MDEAWGKIFLQASRASYTSQGPPKQSEILKHVFFQRLKRIEQQITYNQPTLIQMVYTQNTYQEQPTFSNHTTAVMYGSLCTSFHVRTPSV